jgi:hypothetical protein
MQTKHIFQFHPKGTSSEFCLLNVTASLQLQYGIRSAHDQSSIPQRLKSDLQWCFCVNISRCSCAQTHSSVNTVSWSYIEAVWSVSWSVGVIVLEAYS